VAQAPRRSRPDPRGAARATRLADRLHSAAIHLLRRVRSQDPAMGLSGPAGSALSVIVFRGPLTLGELAAAEQVRPPSITRLVKALEAEGLVARETDPGDRRVQRVRATAKGRQVLQEGRARRVRALAVALAGLSVTEVRRLEDAIEVLERLVRGAGTT
jgi:DNA-binding MarR family transcriptional regulator